jgi:two-component system OmpR family sensor kinase/two-component system sensor histidine kinase BaeS
MHNSLLLKLLGALLVVVAIGAASIAILTSIATKDAFTIYSTHNGIVWAQNLSPLLGKYYSQSHTWQGVESILEANPVGGSGNGQTMGAGQGQGRGNGAGRQNGGYGMMMGSGQRVIVLDASLIVVADTQNELIGNQFSDSQAKNGTPILVDSQQVGTVIVTPGNMMSAGTPAADFIASVNKAIINSTILVTIIAILLGAFLFSQITAPLRRLKEAANAIGKGDLTQRVEIHSKDEFAELGDSFNRMAENLASAEQQRQHLMADVAHELRTPLTAIQGTLEAMQDRLLPMDDEQLEALHSQTTVLNRLINDLRLLSLAEAGQLKLDMKDTDPGLLVRQTLDGFKPILQQKDIHLVSRIQHDLPVMRLDPDRIAQVLNNLISNSIRYTPPGGEISVDCLVDVHNSGLVISVQDSGPGISAEDLPQIFDRFYRADKSRTRTSGGTGLGLTIVKQLVEAHCGKVRAESPILENEHHQGYGTRISVQLPLK